MRLNDKGYNFIKSYEGLRLTSYLCPAGKWTISYGCTFYPNGEEVIRGQRITEEYADEIFKVVADRFAVKVLDKIKQPITQNQFNALVSFAYNCGMGNFINSTLLRLVNINPNDGMIAKEFMKWNRSGGKVLKGLTNRRIAESSMYYSKL